MKQFHGKTNNYFSLVNLNSKLHTTLVIEKVRVLPIN